jgi:hypothetical protein
MCAHFDAKAYWYASARRPVWVVYMVTLSRGKSVARDTKIVRAADKAAAVVDAKARTFIRRPAVRSARLAEPEDLGVTCHRCTTERLERRA